jgi:cytochrome P450
MTTSEQAPQSPAFNPYAVSTDDRYSAMAELRATTPVAETPAGWYVSTYAGVLSALQRVDMFVGSFMDTSQLPEDEVMISAIPEPRHGRIRRVINGAIAPNKTMRVEPFVRDLAHRLMDDALAVAATEGQVDLTAAVVDPIPSTVIARVLGVPVEDFEDFRRWSDELLARQNDGGAQTLSQSHPEFATYIDQQIDLRRQAADPPDDIITRLLQTEVDGERLSNQAVRTQTMFLIVAGNETTRNLIGNCFYRLATDASLYADLRADRSLIPAFVEESLRLDAPVQILGRAARADVEIEGCPVQHGQQVVLGLASANRDEKVYEDPSVFRLNRTRPREHVAFGAGPHVCPGAFLARMEAVVALEELCQRVASFSTVAGYEFDANPVFWALGPRSLPVEVVQADDGRRGDVGSAVPR